MQTYLVHMRNPLQLYRELGARRFCGVQLTYGALVLSALAHPWFYVALAFKHHSPAAIADPDWDPVWIASMLVLVSGYVTGIALPAAAIARRRGGALIFSALWHPIYWLAISVAAYRAVFDLILRPYYWHKTPHRGLAVTHAGFRS